MAAIRPWTQAQQQQGGDHSRAQKQPGKKQQSSGTSPGNGLALSACHLITARPYTVTVIVNATYV